MQQVQTKEQTFPSQQKCGFRGAVVPASLPLCNEAVSTNIAPQEALVPHQNPDTNICGQWRTGTITKCTRVRLSPITLAFL